MVIGPQHNIQMESMITHFNMFIAQLVIWKCVDHV